MSSLSIEKSDLELSPLLEEAVVLEESEEVESTQDETRESFAPAEINLGLLREYIAEMNCDDIDEARKQWMKIMDLFVYEDLLSSKRRCIPVADLMALEYLQEHMNLWPEEIRVMPPYFFEIPASELREYGLCSVVRVWDLQPFNRDAQEEFLAGLPTDGYLSLAGIGNYEILSRLEGVDHEELVLKGDIPTEEGVEMLKRFSRVKRLRLQNAVEDFSFVDAFQELESLEILSLVSLNGTSIEEVLRLPRLTSFKVYGGRCDYTTEEFEQLSGLKELKINLPEDVYGFFQAIAERSPGIERLSVGNARSPLSRIECLEGLNKLKFLEIERIEGITTIETLEGLDDLECLSIDECVDMLDIGVLERLPSLKKVSLSRCFRIANFSVLERMSALEAVVLPRRRFYDNGVAPDFNERMERLKERLEAKGVKVVL